MRPTAMSAAMIALAASVALTACSDGPGSVVSESPVEVDGTDVGLEELRDGFVEGLVLTAPRITEAQANCAFDEAVARGVTFDDFVAIESSPELEAKFAAAFSACGIS